MLTVHPSLDSRKWQELFYIDWELSKGLAMELLVFRLLFLFGGLFDCHVLKLLGIKDIATFQAFNKFGVFMSGDNSYSRVFAGSSHGDIRKGICALSADCIDLS